VCKGFEWVSIEFFFNGSLTLLSITEEAIEFFELYDEIGEELSMVLCTCLLSLIDALFNTGKGNEPSNFGVALLFEDKLDFICRGSGLDAVADTAGATII
jgi:hypothetical protein